MIRRARAFIRGFRHGWRQWRRPEPWRGRMLTERMLQEVYGHPENGSRVGRVIHLGCRSCLISVISGEWCSIHYGRWGA